MNAIHEDHSDHSDKGLSIETSTDDSDDESLRRQAVVSRSHESLTDLLKSMDVSQPIIPSESPKKGLAFDISTQTPPFISKNDMSINTDPPQEQNEQSLVTELNKKVKIMAPVTPDIPKKSHPITQKEPIKIKESKYMDKFLKQHTKKGTVKKKKPLAIPPPSKFPLLEPVKPRRRQRSRSTSRSGSASSRSSVTSSSNGSSSFEYDKYDKKGKRRKSKKKSSKTGSLELTTNAHLNSDPNLYPNQPYLMHSELYSSPYTVHPPNPNTWTNTVSQTSPSQPYLAMPQQHYSYYPQSFDSNPSNYYHSSNSMMYPSTHSSYSALDYNSSFTNPSSMSMNSFYPPTGYRNSNSMNPMNNPRMNAPPVNTNGSKKRPPLALKSTISSERPWH